VFLAYVDTSGVMRNSNGFTMIELLIVIALIGILSAVAAASLMSARISSNEASAIGSIRAIVSAEVDFNGFNRGYATNLATLATACPGMSVAFISSDLDANGVTKNGFRYSLLVGAGAVAGPADCNGAPTQSAFYANAVPVSIGMTGSRAFATNQISAMWQDTSGIAPTEPFTPGPTVSLIGR
jgi:prepilin-type N-terminal cleavage/methylation domain-containing protein